jgi:hypothetical protein
MGAPVLCVYGLSVSLLCSPRAGDGRLIDTTRCQHAGLVPTRSGSTPIIAGMTRSVGEGYSSHGLSGPTQSGRS